MTGLKRFKDAQERPESGFESAIQEMQSGRKLGHWIWYVFPQLAGLGVSSMSETYAIKDLIEAIAYLQDSVLRHRLLAITTVIAEGLKSKPAVSLAMVSRLMSSARGLPLT